MADVEQVKEEVVVVNETPKVVTPAEPDIRVLVARDRMEASLSITIPHGSRHLDMEEVLEKVKNNGVVFGIDHELVKKAYDSSGFSVVFAKGVAPENGINASIKFHVDMENKGRPDEMADGSVDFKNLNLFTMVQQGDLLAEKIIAERATLKEQ